MPLNLAPLEIKLLRLWMDRASERGEAANAAMHLRRLLRDRGVDAYTIEEVLSEARQQPTGVYQSVRESPYAATVLRFGNTAVNESTRFRRTTSCGVWRILSDLWPSTRRAIEMYLNL
jgi:hypothetical protein